MRFKSPPVYSKMTKTTSANWWMKPYNKRETNKAEHKTQTVRSRVFYLEEGGVFRIRKLSDAFNRLALFL